MLKIAVLAADSVKEQAVALLAQHPEIHVVFATSDVRYAVAYPDETYDLLVVDDRVLAWNPSIIGSVVRLPCHKVIIGPLDDIGCARRAIALHAADIVDQEAVGTSLFAAVHPFDDAEKESFNSTVIGIWGTKGGGGNTTLALNLSWAMAQASHHKVALIDLAESGDVGSMLKERPPVSVADVVRGLESGVSADKALQSLYVTKGSGLTIIPAPVSGQDPALDPEHIVGLIDLVRTTHAYVVLDLDKGLRDQTRAALDVCDDILVLALPEKATVRSVARSLELMHPLYSNEISVVLNRADSKTGMDAAMVETALEHPVRFFLPSGGVAPVRASNHGVPLVQADPRNCLALAVSGMTRELLSLKERPRRRLKKASFVRAIQSP